MCWPYYLLLGIYSLGEEIGPLSAKEELRQKIDEKIKTLPAFCREDFENLKDMLFRLKHNEKQRKQVYETWVTGLFQKNRTDYHCSFCGHNVHPSDDGTQEYFCSSECQDSWKRNILVVLSAYM
jgi:hypothetical protein